VKKVIRRGLKEIIVDTVPDPRPGPHQVLVAPVFSLISSGTETASIHQQGVLREVAENPSHLRRVLSVMKTTGPVATAREVMAKFSEYATLGYSGAGVVIEAHPTVTDLQPEDRVAYGGQETGHSEVIVTGRNLAARVPAEVPLEHACFATLGSIALNSIRIAGVQLGETVVVLGLGLVGQLVAQLARLQGATVIATDLRQERVNLAASLGADHAVVGGDGLREAALAITGGVGADCVILAAAAKSAAPAREALAMCRDRGRIVVVGAVEMNFPWEEMYLKEIQILMSRAYGPGSYDPLYEKKGQDYPLPYVRWTENRNMEEFLRLIGNGKVQIQPLVTHVYPLDNAPAAYETIMAPGSSSLAVLLQYPAAEAGAAPVRKHVPTVALRTESKSPDRLGVALIGAGNLARWAHLPALRKISAVDLRAIHSTSGMRGKSYGLRFGAAYCTTDYDAVLRDPEVDAVIIVTRNAEHAEQAAAALEAGKHVFVEKPMALTADECRRIARAAGSSGRTLTVGFNRRFAPYYRAFKERLKRRPGPAVVHIRMNSPGIRGDYWMADPAGGGAILGEACHFADLSWWLLESEPVEVAAYSLPLGKKEPIGENNIVAALRFADGSIANLSYCTVGSRTSGGERVEAFADGIGLATEDFCKLTVNGALPSSRRKLFPDKGYDEQLAAFVRSLREGREPEVTVRDGVRATVVCLAILEACRSGQPQAVDLEIALG
jgi:predicted dehydrogenase/threonine dehydrogenase-like Zn-dependent dehydrogenase